MADDRDLSDDETAQPRRRKTFWGVAVVVVVVACAIVVWYYNAIKPAAGGSVVTQADAPVSGLFAAAQCPPAQDRQVQGLGGAVGFIGPELARQGSLPLRKSA